MDGNALLKTYALSMKDKMAAGAFGRARNYVFFFLLPFVTDNLNAEDYVGIDALRSALRVRLPLYETYKKPDSSVCHDIHTTITISSLKPFICLVEPLGFGGDVSTISSPSRGYSG